MPRVDAISLLGSYLSVSSDHMDVFLFLWTEAKKVLCVTFRFFKIFSKMQIDYSSCRLN